jgi:hypothetical protein
MAVKNLTAERDRQRAHVQFLGSIMAYGGGAPAGREDLIRRTDVARSCDQAIAALDAVSRGAA